MKNNYITIKNKLMEYIKFKNKQEIANLYKDTTIYKFGSEDSLDFDAIIFVEKIPDNQTCKEICFYYKTEFDLNLNLCVVNNGVIIDSFKGSIDEMSNSFFITFKYHDYNNNKVNPIKLLVKRDVSLKIIRCIRICLSLISKSHYRIELKKALASYDFNKRLEVLELIEWNTIDVALLTTDMLKTIAFQVGQTIDLMKGVESYTKKSVSTNNPDLEFLISRKQFNSSEHRKEILFNLQNIIRYDFILPLKTYLEAYKDDSNIEVNKFRLKIALPDSFKYYDLVNSFINSKIDLKNEVKIL